MFLSTFSFLLSFIHKHIPSSSIPFISSSLTSLILRCHRHHRLRYTYSKPRNTSICQKPQIAVTTPPYKSSSRTQRRMEAICPVGDQYQNNDSLSDSENSPVNNLPPPPEPFPVDLLSQNVSSSIGSRAESDQTVSAWRSLEIGFERGYFRAVLGLTDLFYLHEAYRQTPPLCAEIMYRRSFSFTSGSFHAEW